jgi:prolipoprotein diacylglyceryl transferase
VTTTILASFPSPGQGVWHLGPIPIRAYAMFILLGVIAALFIGNKRWANRGGEPGVIFDIALWAIIFGLIGGRLYHVLTDWSTYFGPGGAGLKAAFMIQEGGLGIWGAVALGGVGAWIGCRRKGIPLPAFGDAIAPGIVLAQAIGRIGNYFNQELYGRTTSLPWGLEIFERRDGNGALDSLNGVSTGQLIEVVHPTFLYELLWNLLVFVLLIWVDRRFRIGHGRLFSLYVAAYCFGRFWIELMRSDMATHIAGIRINSFVSVFVFIGAVVYIMVAPKGREDPSELLGYAEEDERSEDSPTEKIEKELVAVAATTGVVAAAKAAGEKDDEDATEILESGGAEVPESDGEDEPGIEAVAESEQLAEDVSEAPAGVIAEAEAFAEAGEESEPTEAIGGVGAVEGDEVAEAEEDAQEVHEAAVEGAEEAAEAADEVADEEPAADAEEEEPASDAEEEEPAGDAEAADEGDAEETEAEAGADEAEQPAEETEQPAEADAASDEAEGQPAEVGGVGSVEGDEVVEAEESAPEVHEAAVEGAEEAAEAADVVADEQGGEDTEDSSQETEEPK